MTVREPINKPWSEFRYDSRCAPGVVVVFDNGVEELIGDVNTLGGYCDDCSIWASTIVVEVIDLRALVAREVES